MSLHIPGTWASTIIGEVCDTYAGNGFPKYMQGKKTGDLPFFKVGNISDAWQHKQNYLVQANNYLTHEEARSLHARPLPQDSTVFAKIGAAIALNRRAILSRPSLVDNNVMGLHPKAGCLDPRFLFYFMWTIRLGDASRATTVPSVRKGDIENIPLPLPPLPEQHRIVAEIETQFTRLDASVAALKRGQANLKRYRASVLKAACEGKLVPTEAELARQEGRDYEPAPALLERILKERRARWEALENRRGQYKEPADPDTSALPELPEGWVWATVGQASEIQGGIQKQPKRAPRTNAFPFLRVANVLRGRLDLEEVHEVELFPGELKKLRLKGGDLLIIEGNGSPSEIGRMAIWNGNVENCVHQNHIIRARTADGVLPNYVESYWNSSDGSARVLKVASSTSGLYTLSVSKIAVLPVPLPPFDEQKRIVAEVERHLSVIQATENIVGANLKRAERLRHSILKQAFSGKLVPQDPNDEPASSFLERIRQEQQTAKPEQTAGHRRTGHRQATATRAEA